MSPVATSIKKYINKKTVVIAAIIALLAVAALTVPRFVGERASATSATETTTVKLGIGEQTPVWDKFAEVAERDHGVKIQFVNFSDWNLPNTALVNKEIDANAFQHVLFLSQFNHASGTDLRPVGVTSLGTLGVYSDQAKDLESIQDGGKILVPNDPTNQGRALLLLDRLGLLKIDPKVGIFATIDDVTENPHNYQLTPLVAQQIPTSLKDAAAIVTYQSQAVNAGIDKETVLATDLELVHEPEFLPYQAVIAARAEDQDDPVWKKLEEAYHSQEVVDAYHKENNGLGVISKASLEDLLKVQKEVEEKLAEQKDSK